MTHAATCPFCGSTQLHTVHADQDMWFVECGSCCCTGPIRQSEHQALIAWISRADLHRSPSSWPDAPRFGASQPSL